MIMCSISSDSSSKSLILMAHLDIFVQQLESYEKFNKIFYCTFFGNAHHANPLLVIWI